MGKSGMSQSFGRRPTAKPLPAPLPVPVKFARPGNVQPPRTEPAPPSLDDELKEWKKSRGSNFPFKLLALTASLSFGIASVALPAQINDWAQYPLYALSAASLYAGFVRRKPKI
jgi:hypothetical protein